MCDSKHVKSIYIFFHFKIHSVLCLQPYQPLLPSENSALHCLSEYLKTLIVANDAPIPVSASPVFSLPSAFEKWDHVNNNAEACLTISGHRCQPFQLAARASEFNSWVVWQSYLGAGTSWHRGWASCSIDSALSLSVGKLLSISSYNICSNKGLIKPRGQAYHQEPFFILWIVYEEEWKQMHTRVQEFSQGQGTRMGKLKTAFP